MNFARGTIILGIAALFVALIARFPLAWIGNQIQTSETIKPDYLGTIWDGRVTGIPSVAPVKIKTNPLKLLGGKALNFSSSSPGLSFSGAASAGRSLDINVKGNMAALSQIENRLKGLAGDYELDVSDMKIKDVCENGQGTVSTDILARNNRSWQWRGPKLSGPVSCEDGQIVLKLDGSEAGQTLESDLRLGLDGVYRLTVNIKTRDQRAGVFLPLYGFEPVSGGYRLSEAGNWR